jgi:hypothetical protein
VHFPHRCPRIAQPSDDKKSKFWEINVDETNPYNAGDVHGHVRRIRAYLMNHTVYIILTFLTFASATAMAKDPSSHAAFDALAMYATTQLPAGWHVAERVFGPQDIPTYWGSRPVGLQVRLDGPHLRHPQFYSGLPMTPNQEREYFPRPSRIRIYLDRSS